MKISDIDNNFYQKERNSSKGKKKTYLKENDGLDRKRKIQFKNFMKSKYEITDIEDDEDDDESY